ncbi:MAG: aldo/keto reductase [Pseudomonadota bacterium]
MQYRRLGRTDLDVSQLCLGSMTWGTQNTTEEGHRQIDLAFDHGVNFVDTAEMYPTTPRTDATQGDTERVIGDWVARGGARERMVLATKISGVGATGARKGEPISGDAMRRALEASLARLQTDYVDLYQLHWPNRGSYHFRQYWNYNPTRQSRAKTRAHIRDVLETAAALVDEGKIRHLGLSNESAWGTQQFLDIAEAEGLPRVVSIQNEYSLLCRIFDLDLAELCHNEDVGLLAFSPLAAGMLSGKYLGDAIPPGSRRSIQKDLNGRLSPRAPEAVTAYVEIARRHGLDPCQMALAWCCTRPFMTSAIFGATTMAQLENALGAAEITLSPEVMEEIAATHRAYPMPY